jgi:hypothetical protein
MENLNTSSTISSWLQKRFVSYSLFDYLLLLFTRLFVFCCCLFFVCCLSFCLSTCLLIWLFVCLFCCCLFSLCFSYLLFFCVCLVLLVCHFGCLLVHDRDFNVILGSWLHGSVRFQNNERNDWSDTMYQTVWHSFERKDQGMEILKV